MPFLPPNQQRQSTEGTLLATDIAGNLRTLTFQRRRVAQAAV